MTAPPGYPPPGPPGAPPLPSGAPMPGAPASRGRSGRGGIVVIIVLVGVILLCGGLGTTGYLLVAKVPPGAGSPPAAVSKLLDTVFHQGDASGAARYICDQQRQGAGSVTRALAQASQASKSEVTWSEPKQTGGSSSKATVTSDLNLNGGQAGSSDGQTWTFSVVNEAGWRVCGIKTGT